MSTDWKKLKVIHYPDPRLRGRCKPVTEFNADLAVLAERMIELMHEHKGVGLAAAQVGVPLRIFVANPTDDRKNDRVYVNPELFDLEGAKEAEEGCLSIPDVHIIVRRPLRARIKAQDVTGAAFERAAEDFEARVWQHETDHLNGVLIIDKMGPSDRIASKKKLKELEEEFESTRRR